MALSKYVIGVIFIIAALVSIVPLFKNDYDVYSLLTSRVKIKDGFEKKDINANSLPVSNESIGLYNGKEVKFSDLTTQEKQSLFDAQSQMYKVEEGVLGRFYFDSVIEKYAKDNKIADKNIAQKEYLQNNVKVEKAEIDAFLKENRDNPQLLGKPLDQQIALVKPYLLQQKAASYYNEVLDKARAEGAIKVTGIQKPESPRIAINIQNSPSKGPKNAPITIVEFADYQCPYCSAAEPTIKSLLNKYKNKIHFVFKSYPLTQIHPQALNASIAAECANLQGKFWQMHPILFENHSKLSDNSYKEFAKQIGLNLNKFESCFVDASIKEKVMNDANYGQSLGINATPAFYVNGILLMGAQPESEFIRIIDKELEKS